MNTVRAELAPYIAAYPTLRQALDILQASLELQAGRATVIEAGPVIGKEVAYARWQADLPLLAADAFAVPTPFLRETLMALRLVLAHYPQAQATLDGILASTLVVPAAGSVFSCDLSEAGQESMGELATTLALEPEFLTSILHMALAPVYQLRAAPYQAWLDTTTWLHGTCPICGAGPSMARLAREGGRRLLACALCRSEWVFPRLRCPFCAVDARPHLRHFTVAEDPAHRVDCCDRCRRYLKTVDERRLAYQPFIPGEEVVTAYLDDLAREQGYQ